jgi:hypothetical protein
MSDAVIFLLIFVGFFVLRGVAATVVFFYLLPEGITVRTVMPSRSACSRAF